MKKLSLFFILMFSIMIISNMCYSKEEKIKIEKTIKATGIASIENNNLAKAKDIALLDAQVKALESVVGVFIDAETTAKGYTEIDKKIYKNTKGFIKSYKIIEGSEKTEEIENCPVYSLEIEAEINVNQVYDKLSDIKEIYNQIGKPKFCILASSSSNLGYNDSDLIEDIVSKKLKEYDFDIVDSTVLKLKTGAQDNPDHIYDVLKDNNIKIVVWIEIDTIQQSGALEEHSKSEMTVKFVDIDNGETYYTHNLTGYADNVFGIGNGSSNQAIKNTINKFFKKNEKELKAELFNKWVDVANYNTFTLKLSNLKNDEIQTLKDNINNKDRFIKQIGKHKLKNKKIEFTVSTKTDIDTFVGYIEEIEINNKHIDFSTIDRNVIEGEYISIE